MSVGATPAVDVLMTAYNAERTVVSSAKSILCQTFVSLRLIVVNDGSTDGTGRLLDELADYDARVTVIHRPNGGIVDAAKAGLAMCTAEFVARQDADDLSFPQRLSRQMAHMQRESGCVAVSGAAYHVGDDGRRTGFLVALDPPDKADPTAVPSHEPYVMHPFMLARRAALIAAGGYRDVEYAEDTDLCWRLQELGRLDILPEAVGEYRVHTGSVSSSSVISGRISAVNSQLSAISATRRRRKRPDLAFAPGDVAAYRAAVTLPAMLALVAPRLDDDEQRYLRVASAAKLLELSLYRPYRLTEDDCSHIAACLGAGSAIDADDRTRLRYMLAEAAAMMVLERRFAEARILGVDLRFRSVARRVLQRAGRALFTSRRPQNRRELGRELASSEADRAFLMAVSRRP